MKNELNIIIIINSQIQQSVISLKNIIIIIY